MIPFFCQGKETPAVTSESVGLGTREIPVTNAAGFFRAGERIFISDPGGGAVEYLGRADSVQGDSVAVQLVTSRTHPVGAAVWTPAADFEWPAGPDASARRTRHTGVKVMRALGGGNFSTRLHDAYEIEGVKFDNLPEGRFANLAQWFEDTAQDGLSEFTYVDGARAVRRVRLDLPTLEWQRTARRMLDIAFNLQLIEEAYI